jgi:preprotein translocase subunit SecF
MRAALSEFGEIQVQPTMERGVLLRLRSINESEHQKVLGSLGAFGEFREDRFDSIGPSIGQELASRALRSIIIVSILIILYIAWAFRKVSRPISSWKYGLVAIVALVHDIIIPTGIVSVLGKTTNFEIDAFFVTALLTILGFSVHDTIVVFDRIRENLQKKIDEPFDNIANRSVNEVIGRSINTTVTLLLVLVAIFVLGGSTTKGLALVLGLGLFFGTYSSIFVASPLLTLLLRYGNKR